MEPSRVEINPCLYGQLNFDKGGEDVQQGKERQALHEWCWEDGTDMGKRMKLLLSHTIHKNKLKMDERL